MAAPAALWGLGTALGELPPYFVARAAARSGRLLEELEEVEALERAAAAAAGGQPTAAPTSAGKPAAAARSLGERAKVYVYESIQRYGFWAILLAASIPNPVRYMGAARGRGAGGRGAARR